MTQFLQDLLQYTRFAGVIVLTVVVGVLATGSPVSAASPARRQPGMGQQQAIVTAALSDVEQDALTYMREEEKLARDVYTVWADTWGLPIFANIATSEQRHMDVVGRLLDRYGLPDPTEGLAPGEYANAELQALYDQLIAQGSVSLEAALQTGVTIEEVDIADLEARLVDVTHNDISRVFTNLHRGSTYHLAAFTQALE